jgi:hypothetical protein
VAIIGLDYSGGQNLIEWSIFNADQELVESGGCNYTLEDAYCDVEVCLADGCYSLLFTSDMPIGAEGVLEYFINSEEAEVSIQDYTVDSFSGLVNFGINADCGVAVDENETDELSVFPVPADDYLTVNGIPVDSGIIRIFDMSGRMVYSERVSGRRLQVDLSLLSNGLYRLVLGSPAGAVYGTTFLISK